ncbi:hypothetical protein [Anaeromyxobacter oryzae]|uniref:Uncharacterized protein n=1 Tax=Anaeromyxobacter oryzae TaxID=2918170 RepID=A0ABN6MYG7_9BACT|nr:hypothetical protein [Anaeromyxobacter oryzae]BDG06012.1 hypothetical protein AMOR_50080 [Anaeromyxobacter oryzae]
MGALARIGIAAAAACALVLIGPARAAASTETEPIARLTLEGGYDSNPLYDGRSDRMERVSPELGLRVRDPLWDFDGLYLGDYLVYDRAAPQGIWNHRGLLELKATPTRRLELGGVLRGGYAYDPVGLAQMGIFRSGEQAAWTINGRGRAEYRVAERIDGAVTFTESTVVFQDRTGGAMHAPGAEALYRLTRRLSVGAAYALGFFQGFDPKGNAIAFSHGLRGRARYRITRHVLANVYAGPAFWTGPDGHALVPELGGELELSNREWDLRTSAVHGLGIGSTARPGLVDSIEVGFVRRLGRTRTFDLRGDGGIWRSGQAPTGANATLGYAASGELGWRVAQSLRLALHVSHYDRLDNQSPALERTTVGLRLGWSWEPR